MADFIYHAERGVDKFLFHEKKYILYNKTSLIFWGNIKK